MCLQCKTNNHCEQAYIYNDTRHVDLLLARDVAFSNNEALIYDTLIRPVVYLIPLGGCSPQLRNYVVFRYASLRKVQTLMSYSINATILIQNKSCILQWNSWYKMNSQHCFVNMFQHLTLETYIQSRSDKYMMTIITNIKFNFTLHILVRTNNRTSNVSPPGAHYHRLLSTTFVLIGFLIKLLLNRMSDNIWL